MIVPENYKLTVNSCQFLFMDEEIPGGKKIWGFGSAEQIRICSSSSDLYGDGTFDLVKSCMFMQLWIIVTRSASLGISFPALFFLFPDKSYPTYKSCMEKMRELGIQSPDKFHLDFEAAAIKAAKEVWPDTRIVTCDTHWKRALRNGQSQSGLTAMVNQDSDMQNWCRTVWALCFVPEEEVLKVWTDVIHKSAPFVAEPDDPDYDCSLSPEEVIQWNTALDNYIKYLEYTWIGRVSPKTGKRGSGLYKIHIWNK